MWSPQEVIRRIRATEKTAAAIPERYSDELLGKGVAGRRNVAGDYGRPSILAVANRGDRRPRPLARATKEFSTPIFAGDNRLAMWPIDRLKNARILLANSPEPPRRW